MVSDGREVLGDRDVVEARHRDLLAAPRRPRARSTESTPIAMSSLRASTAVDVGVLGEDLLGGLLAALPGELGLDHRDVARRPGLPR